MVAPVMMVLCSAVSVLRTADSLVTVTVSDVAPICMVTSMRFVVATCTRIFSWVNFLKPVTSIVIR